MTLLLLGCSGEQPKPRGPGTVDLLQRRPDAVLAQAGSIVPTAEEIWGDLDRGGWGDWLSTTNWGDEVVWTMNRRSRLRLSAGPPKDRELVLRVIAPSATKLAGEEKAGEKPHLAAFVTVALNGIELGEIELRREPYDAKLASPADAWHQGDNLLAFEVNRMSLGSGGIWHGFGLASLKYDREITVRCAPDSEIVELGPGGGVTYSLLTGAGDALEIEGSTDGDGVLEIGMHRLAPETGIREALAATATRVEASEGRVSAHLTLPSVTPDVLLVQLDWSSPDERTLRVERLAHHEREERLRPPVLFISIDTLAARNMSLYGYERSTTPHLEAFAAEAVTFHCRANAPRTLRSYLSQLTGLYPASHFVENETKRRWRPPVEEHQLAPNRWTLAELLRAGGWATAAWVDNPWLVNGVGLQQGFDLYDTSAGEIDHWGEESDPDGGIRHIVPRALRWLNSLPPGTAPFAFVQALDVHGPYQPIEPWLGHFKGDPHYEEERREPVAGEMVDVFRRVPTYVARGAYPEGDLPEEVATGPLHAAYDEKILELDAELGRFFESLRSSGLLDEAIVIVSADHGESMLEHDFWFGHGTLHAESLEVPLLVRLPGGEQGGRQVETPVQLVDLYPTIAELVGLPPVPFTHGRSLVPALRGDRLDPTPLLADGGIMRQYALEYDGWKVIESTPAYASFQTMLSHERVNQDILAAIPGLTEAQTSNRGLRVFFEKNPQRFADLSIALHGTFHELYHLAQDPEERNDLSEDQPEKLAQLLELMTQERARVEHAQALAQPHVQPVELDATQKERLKNLGYLDAGDDGDPEEGDPDDGDPNEDHHEGGEL